MGFKEDFNHASDPENPDHACYHACELCGAQPGEPCTIDGAQSRWVHVLRLPGRAAWAGHWWAAALGYRNIEYLITGRFVDAIRSTTLDVVKGCGVALWLVISLGWAAVWLAWQLGEALAWLSGAIHG